MDAASFATAYALSSAAGFRPFLTLAIASLAMHFGYVHPSHAFASLGTDGATWLLAGLAALEFVAEKVPGVDHTLHVAHFAVKPVAAAILVGSVIPDPGLAPNAMMGVAALNALGIHTGVATLRGAATSTTMGLGNPVVSIIEDVVTGCAALLAIFIPYIGLAVAIVLTILMVFVARAIWRLIRRPATPLNASS